jgi:hypothetical protein
VALSSTEAEYMALTLVAKEAIWLHRLLAELGFVESDDTTSTPMTIFEDNQSAIALAKNPIHHARSKHIDIQHHFIREKVESGEVKLEYTSSEEMIADAMTKALLHFKFEKHVRSMNVVDLTND